MTTTAQGFTAAQGYIEYHTITRAGWRGCCAPYGVCGPFASESEAATALELLRTAQRDPSLTVARCGMLATSDTAAELAEDQELARQQLAALVSAQAEQLKQ